jgi:SPX domain protein involved in polyphosphate accumulation
VGLNGASLRRLILEIPLRDDPSHQAFLSVDHAFNNASTKFYFYKANASECRSRITTLLPYLVFTNVSKEKGIKSCFSGDANERAKGVRWDAERMEVLTADDEIMDMYHSIYDEDDDQDLVDDFTRKILLDFAEVTGTSFGAKPAARATKVQETDAASH